MFRDIALPKNNEDEFVELAAKLGIKKICFLYDFDERSYENTQKKLRSIGNNSNLIIEAGFTVTQKNIGQASRLSKLLAVKSSGNDRFFIESKKVRIIYGFEEFFKRDPLHQRASGLNHIVCELCRKNGVAVGLPYGSLLNKNSQIASLLIGRFVQNIRLCQKYNVKLLIGSFSDNPFDMRSPYDIISLFSLFGMDGKEIKEALSINPI